MRLGPGGEARPNVLLPWYQSRYRSGSGFDLFDSLLQYDPARRCTAKEALAHPWFTKEEPVPTRNAFASLPAAGASTYPSRRLHSDTTDPVMAVDPSQVAVPPPFANAAAGGTAMPLPGPPAPAPAPASGGSLPNSVGASHSHSHSVGLGSGSGIGTGGATQGGGGTAGGTGAGGTGVGGSSTAQSGRGGMVATAAANATAQAQAQAQQNKRARLG